MCKKKTLKNIETIELLKLLQQNSHKENQKTNTQMCKTIIAVAEWENNKQLTLVMGAR